jgi:hypothetical protein
MGILNSQTIAEEHFSKYKIAYKIIIALGEIFIFWAVIVARVFSFNRFIGNELDVLPFARQFYNRGWLPNDWYLNLDVGYRQVFNYIQGFLADWLGFLNGAYAGRIIVYLFLAVALFIFFRAIRLRFFLGLIVVILFLDNQSLVAGEWVVGGVDPKTFAYSFSLLALAAFYSRKYLAGFALAGAALSFHVLIGIFALFCVIFAILLTQKLTKEYFNGLVRKSWPFFLTGIFGVFAIIQQLLPQADVNTSQAWNIYVEFRVPHHVLPSTWERNEWIFWIALAMTIFLILFIANKKGALKFVAAYALGSVILFAIGMALFALDLTSLLRFYWFRFPDVMVPFLSMVLIALLLNGIANLNFINYPRFPKSLYWTQWILRIGLPVLFVIYAFLLVAESRIYLQGKYQRGLKRSQTKTQVALEWIRENTEEDAVFLVDPLMNEFYVYANRARFISFSHPPQSAAELLEWYRRLTLINGNQTPSIPPNRGDMQANFANLDPGTIQQLANEYGVSYYLGQAGKQLPFDLVYQDDSFALYRVDVED